FNPITTKQQKNTNVEKNEKEFTLTISLPGFKKEEIQISTDNSILKINAKRTKKIGWLQEEYNQSYNLENNIDIEKITAKLEDGILNITLPLKEQPKPNTIKIQ
ncbi:MAG: Hsp20/alpha crystallin family protein, partial [Methanothrix sp.]|nr:Hsp20/alpha crystallin family protein [Methanothrix sp.]